MYLNAFRGKTDLPEPRAPFKRGTANQAREAEGMGRGFQSVKFWHSLPLHLEWIGLFDEFPLSLEKRQYRANVLIAILRNTQKKLS